MTNPTPLTRDLPKNEPQLSAEQKKEWVVKTITKWMSESQEGMAIHVLSNYVNERIATALEEQRKMILSEVEELRLCHTCDCDKLLLAKLNQLKEEGK